MNQLENNRERRSSSAGRSRGRVQIKARDGERPGIQAEAVRQAAVQANSFPTVPADRPAG